MTEEASKRMTKSDTEKSGALKAAIPSPTGASELRPLAGRKAVVSWAASVALLALGLVAIPIVRNADQCDVKVSPACSELQFGPQFWVSLCVVVVGVVAALTGLFSSRSSVGRTLSLLAALLLVVTAAIVVGGVVAGGAWNVGLVALAETTTLVLSGLLVGAGVALQEYDDPAVGPSGLRDPPRPPISMDALGSIEYFLSWWEAEFSRARRVVKRRASLVTIWASILTGVVAVLGAVSAALSNNVWIDVVAIATTASSATIAVLLAWNDHFHHPELWIQRSGVLSELQALRREYELSSRSETHGDNTDLAKDLSARLDAILSRDIESWARIQGGNSKGH